MGGNNYRAALCIVRGKDNSALNEYFQVKDATVSSNTFVNCNEAFCINYNSSSECTMPPLSTTIEDNIVYNDASRRIVTVSQSGGTVTWLNNRYNTGTWKSYSPASPAWILDADMTQPEAADPELATDNICSPVGQCARKIVHDGQLCIEVNGRLYTVIGQPQR